MPEEDKKFFDISKPNSGGASPTSRPIIVGHHPTMPDPMVKGRESDDAQPIDVNVKTGTEPEKVAAFGDTSSPYQASPAVADPLNNDALLPPTAKPPINTEPPHDTPLNVPSGHKGHNYHHKPRIWVWVLAILIVLALIYAAIDAKTDILPFHIFNKAKKVQTGQPSNAAPTNNQPATTQPVALPPDYVRYQPTGAPLTFGYPSAWGTPTTTTDPGFSQRGTGKKSDGTHAYLVHFATNKDVEVAITSTKYLPAARGTLYYDFLQWCVGTNDSKVYKQTLHFTTSSGVDTPSTISCDQGPLADATKLSNAIIVQLNTKDASGAAIGDLYTANLSDVTYSVLRVKDAKMTNGDNIKKLLATISGTPQ